MGTIFVLVVVSILLRNLCITDRSFLPIFMSWGHYYCKYILISALYIIYVYRYSLKYIDIYMQWQRWNIKCSKRQLIYIYNIYTSLVYIYFNLLSHGNIHDLTETCQYRRRTQIIRWTQIFSPLCTLLLWLLTSQVLSRGIEPMHSTRTCLKTFWVIAASLFMGSTFSSKLQNCCNWLDIQLTSCVYSTDVAPPSTAFINSPSPSNEPEYLKENSQRVCVRWAHMLAWIFI